MLHRLVSDFPPPPIPHSFVPSLWHGEMEVLKEITSCVGVLSNKPVSLQRERPEGERGP